MSSAEFRFLPAILIMSILPLIWGIRTLKQLGLVHREHASHYCSGDVSW